MPFICHSIWFGRNEFVFNNKFLPATYLLTIALKWWDKFRLIPHVQSSLKPPPVIPHHWEKLAFLYIKINVDGAVCLQFGIRGLGTLLGNESSGVMLSGSKGLIGNFSPKATEFYASLGLQLAFHGILIRLFNLEMGSQSIIQLLQEDVNFSMEGVLVEGVKSFLHFFNSIICTCVPREYNQALHNLAKNALLFPAFRVGRGRSFLAF